MASDQSRIWLFEVYQL